MFRTTCAKAATLDDLFSVEVVLELGKDATDSPLHFSLEVYDRHTGAKLYGDVPLPAGSRVLGGGQFLYLLMDRDFPRTWSYSEAWTVIRRWAGFLSKLGAEPRAESGSRVTCITGPRLSGRGSGPRRRDARTFRSNRGHRGALLADQLRRSRACVLVTEASALSYDPSAFLLYTADRVPKGWNEGSEILFCGELHSGDLDA